MNPVRGLPVLSSRRRPVALAVGSLAALSLLVAAPLGAQAAPAPTGSTAPVSATVTAPVSAPVAAPVSAADPQAEAGPARTFLSLNVAGRLPKENGGRVDPVASDLVSAVRKRPSLYAGVLQEVCGRQAKAIDQRLTGYRVVFFPTGVECAGGQAFGNAVLIRNGPVVRNRVALPTGGEGSRNLGCVTRKTPRMAVCSTHLTADRDRGGVRRDQARRIASVTEGYVRRGFPTFVGGDFNDTPTANTLDPLYRRAYGQGAVGVFTESNGCCGRDGAPTLGTAKFDYGFASSHWQVRRSWAARSYSSDHRRLWTVLRRR